MTMLRQIEDGEGDEWVESAPGSNRYHLGNRECDDPYCFRCTCSRERITELFGIIRDLHPIRAKDFE